MDEVEPGKGGSQSIDSKLQRLADYETIEIDPEWRSAISLIREVVRLVEYNNGSLVAFVSSRRTASLWIRPVRSSLYSYVPPCSIGLR